MTMQFTFSTSRRPVELCQLVGRWDRKTIPDGDVLAESKIDGWRGLHFRGLDGQPRIWTRGGHEIPGTGHILHVIAEMERIAGQRLFIDGEFQIGDSLAATKAWCESGHKLGGEAGTFHAFDILPEADWQAGCCDMPLIERKAWLRSLIDAAMASLSGQWEWREGSKGRDLGTPIVAIPHVEIGAVRGVLMLAEEVWARGGEGIVLKQADSLYVRARSNDWMKVKKVGVR